MKRIAIFASGSGSNTENIALYFANKETVQISLIVCNKPDAFVLERAKKLQIPTLLINREQFYHSKQVIDILREYQIDWVVLAGFLWLVPENLVQAFPNTIINIHPALLPKFGGKGMYGHHVHRAVKDAGETETGITIHYVNKEYDKGAIIAQFKTQIDSADTPETIARKVHQLEYEFFPKVIEEVIDNQALETKHQIST